MGVIRLFAVAVSMVILAPLDAGAQYFGRNKVEYVDFDFRVLGTAHFDVYYYPREEAAARIAAQLAERWYTRFAQLMHHEFDRRQPLVLYGSQPEFAQTNVVSGFLSDTIGGVTESARRRIAMPFAPTLAETNRVLGHEIVHAFQFDIARRHGGGTGQPLWFIEGMAEYLARGGVDAEASLWLRDAVLSGRLPPRQRDAARRLSPYQYGHALWAYLAERFGDAVVEAALKPGKQKTIEARMRRATGRDLDVLFAEWREAVVAAHGPGAAPANPGDGTRPPRAFGRMQLGPALSPDGRHAVFFSERDRLALDLFLGEVDTGRILRKLATTAASARFDSLQPLRSAGAWSPSGEWFAFAAVRRGRAALTVLNMRRPGADREIVLSDLGQVLSASWSPDGAAIALSALAGGFTDLYVYELASGKVRQLTADAFADLHPAWSPDGRAIAFATERYSSDLSALSFGRTQLAAIDLDSGLVRAITDDFATAHVNPQWAADGRHLYFVADPDGVRNVFRVDPQTRATDRITSVVTGVSGVTPTSPALSVARNAPVLAFTVYRNGTAHLEVLRDPGPITGEPVGRAPLEPSGGTHPSAAPGSVAALLADSRSGLPDPGTIVGRKYSPRLLLERIGQPYVSSGGGPFGTFVRGGTSVLFGDMLGERRLGAAVQIGNRLRDAAFEARFLNQERRWNWGAIAELEPAIRRYRRTQEIEYGGEAALLKEADYLQRVQWRAAGLVAYPFDRGLRVELTAGLRHASYQRDLSSQVSSAATGRVLDHDTVELSGGAPTTVAEVGAALVGDTTVFGPTGPILGARYRFEVAPARGSLDYTRVVVDYRRYLMPVRPYSIALRLLHSGRYGRDGDDPRLLSSFLGSRYLVRGHALDTRSCQPDRGRVCGDELLGNRLLVGNVEVRFPIWGVLSRQIDYGPLPADAFLFLDRGVVWSGGRAAHPSTAFGPSGTSRTVISSLGGGIRLNAGGLPFEIAGVRALDGPAPRWLFDFGFRLGF